MRNFACFVLALAIGIGCGGGGGGTTTPPPQQPLENQPEKAAQPPPKAQTDDELANVMMEELVAVFVDSGEDCGKLAAGLDTFTDRRKADLVRLKDYDKTLEGDKKAEWEAKTKKMSDKMMPVMMKCANDERVQKSMERLSNDGG